MKRKRNLKQLAALCMILTQPAAYASGLLFNVAATGTPGNVDITLCLNAKGPISCQHYKVSALSLSISTAVPNHFYPDAGIIINTPGYTLANLGVECRLYKNGYCMFGVGNNQPTTITIQGPFNPVLTAVGQDTGSNNPLLVTSADKGTSWSVIPTSGFTNNGVFNASSCTGSGTSAICTAVGDNPNVPFGLLAVSTNGGKDWTSPTLPVGSTTGRFLFATSCTGSGSNAICVAAGEDHDVAGGAGYLLVGANGATSWSGTSFGVYYDNFNAVSCTGSGSSAICAAAGTNTSSHAPLLAVSTNGGANWVPKTISGITSDAIFNTASCTGSGSTAICVIAGHSSSLPYTPLLAVSIDGGNTWVSKTVPLLSSTAFFEKTSCTGSGSNAICTAVGEENLLSGFVAASTDGGVSWSKQTITGIQDPSHLYGTSCTGSGSNAVCIAVGEDNINFPNGPGFIAVSTNGSVSWAAATIPGIPSYSRFNAASCTGSGSTANCVVAGRSGGPPYTPLLGVSINSGAAWTTVVNSDFNFPANGIFYGAAASSNLTKISRPKKFGLENALEHLNKN